MAESYPNGLKHCGKGKGEIACYEQFLLFPQCFQKACFPGVTKGVIVWEWVNPYQNKPFFSMSAVEVFENTVGKGENPHKEKYILYPHCVLPFWRTLCHFHQIQNCRLQLFQFGRD